MITNYDSRLTVCLSTVFNLTVHTWNTMPEDNKSCYVIQYGT